MAEPAPGQVVVARVPGDLLADAAAVEKQRDAVVHPRERPGSGGGPTGPGARCRRSRERGAPPPPARPRPPPGAPRPAPARDGPRARSTAAPVRAPSSSSSRCPVRAACSRSGRSCRPLSTHTTGGRSSGCQSLQRQPHLVLDHLAGQDHRSCQPATPFRCSSNAGSVDPVLLGGLDHHLEVLVLALVGDRADVQDEAAALRPRRR